MTVYHIFHYNTIGIITFFDDVYTAGEVFFVSEKHIFRIQKNKNYSVMSNYHLNDKNLSWKAKGIHSYVLSLPDDWTIIINHLITVSTDKERATRSGLKELYDNRYWQKYPVYIDGIVDHWETKISELPFDESKIIKSIIYRDGVEVVNYKITDSNLSTNLSTDKHGKDVDKLQQKENLLCQNSQVVENTKFDLLCQNVHVGNVDVENEGLLNTNNILITDYSNYSVSQSRKEDGRTDEKNQNAQDKEFLNQIQNKIQFELYNDQTKELLQDTINRLLSLQELKTNTGIYNKSSIRYYLSKLDLSICDIAIQKYRQALEEKQIENKANYFMIVLFNAILEKSANNYNPY